MIRFNKYFQLNVKKRIYNLNIPEMKKNWYLLWTIKFIILENLILVIKYVIYYI